eukprot:scaffold693_cov399-Prasinococcus_capsulatus_cf.AAC.9
MSANRAPAEVLQAAHWRTYASPPPPCLRRPGGKLARQTGAAYTDTVAPTRAGARRSRPLRSRGREPRARRAAARNVRELQQHSASASADGGDPGRPCTTWSCSTRSSLGDLHGATSTVRCGADPRPLRRRPPSDRQSEIC